MFVVGRGFHLVACIPQVVLLTIKQDSNDNQPFIIVSLRIKLKLIIPIVEKLKENVSILAG